MLLSSFLPFVALFPPYAAAGPTHSSYGQPFSTQFHGRPPIIDTVQSHLKVLLPLNKIPKAVGYFSDWDIEFLEPEDIPWTLYDAVNFAFAIPNENYDLTFGGDDSNLGALLVRFVGEGHKANKLVGLSIGGWTGSKDFSSAVENAESRDKFITNIVTVYHKYNLDLIDLDWEYPGHAGDKGNVYSPKDSIHFLQFLEGLRARLPPDALVTAAVAETPFYGADGRPLADVSQFSKYLDLVTLMNYDVWSGSTTPGPNAPMFDACHNSTRPEGSLAAAYNSWTQAGFPASKLLIGLAAYGVRFRSSAHNLANRAMPMVRDIFDEFGDDDEIPFRYLVSSGALVRDSNGFVAGDGFTWEWDGCSQTPYIYSARGHELVAYDDYSSLRLKAALARAIGMGGFTMFALSGDTPEGDLVRAARAGLGI